MRDITVSTRRKASLRRRYTRASNSTQPPGCSLHHYWEPLACAWHAWVTAWGIRRGQYPRGRTRVAAPAPAPAAARPCVCCSQVRLFYENMYKHRSVWDESEILKPLPAVLQKELVRDMCANSNTRTQRQLGRLARPLETYYEKAGWRSIAHAHKHTRTRQSKGARARHLRDEGHGQTSQRTHQTQPSRRTCCCCCWLLLPWPATPARGCSASAVTARSTTEVTGGQGASLAGCVPRGPPHDMMKSSIATRVCTHTWGGRYKHMDQTTLFAGLDADIRTKLCTLMRPMHATVRDQARQPNTHTPHTHTHTPRRDQARQPNKHADRASARQGLPSSCTPRHDQARQPNYHADRASARQGLPSSRAPSNLPANVIRTSEATRAHLASPLPPPPPPILSVSTPSFRPVPPSTRSLHLYKWHSCRWIELIIPGEPRGNDGL